MVVSRKLETPAVLVHHWRWLEANGYKKEAASCKLQAASVKPQAASVKRQATSCKLSDPGTTVHGY